MRIETQQTTVYTFDELNESAQERALSDLAQVRGEYFDAREQLYDDFAAIAQILGITFDTRPVRLVNGKDRQELCIWWSGFSSQGDGASWEGSYRYDPGASKRIREYAPQDAKLHRLADELQRIQRPFFYVLKARVWTEGNYSHEYTMRIEASDEDRWPDRALPEDDLLEVFRDFARWIYRQIESQYEYETGEESCREDMEGRLFEESGKFYGWE